MSLKTKTSNPTWDASQSLRFLHNISQLVRQEKNSPNFAMKNLGVLTKTFYDQALDPQYESTLTKDQNVELETLFVNLADWIQFGKKEGSNKQQLQINIKLQICLMQIVRFIMTKSNHDPQDHYWVRNVISLALETAMCCYDAERWLEMDWCMNEADFYQNLLIEKWSDIPVQLWAPFLLDKSLNSTLRLLWMQKCMEDDTEAYTHQFAILDSMELSAQQSTIITRMCFNVGLELFHRSSYRTAIFWLKYSHHYAKLSNIGKRGRKASGKVLYLLAMCFYKWNVLKYRDRILHILDCAGASEILAVAELEFRTLLQGKSSSNHLVQRVLKLFEIYVQQEPTKLRENVLRVFNELETNERYEVVVELLNRIPWHTSGKARLDTAHLMPWIQWICAEIAISTCIKRNFQSGCYLWLQEIAQWTPSRQVNLDSLNQILTLAEEEIIKMNYSYLAVKWFRTIVRIARLHGGRPSVITNAIRFSFSLNCVEGFLSVKEILDGEVSQVDLDVQLLRYKLLVAVLDGDVNHAYNICLQLETRYKKSADLNTECWEEALYTLEVIVITAMKNCNNIMSEVANFCLRAMIEEITKRSAPSILLISRVIRFHIQVLFKLDGSNLQVESKCVENLIAALISAYLNLKESMATSSNEQQDAGGLELWFGDLAWSLGRKLNCGPAFYRHQFYKISYKLLNLTYEKDKDTTEKIQTAIALSVAAGINSRSHHNYRKILESCLDMMCWFAEKDSQKIIQLNFYEFYILCELGETKRLLELFRCFQSNEKLRDNPHFFEGLAILASSANQAFLRQIIPTVECRQLMKENDYQQREQKLQMKLTELSIQCLKIANRVHTSSVQFSPITHLVVNWRRIVRFSSENAFLQENIMESHYNCCEEYRRFIQENRKRIDASEIFSFFNHIWNVTAEIRIFKGLKETQRWMEVAKNVASFSTELQKLFRSLQKDLHNKFTGAWD